MEETQHVEKKSLRIVTGNSADWNELAKDCVCFANARGGVIYIGIEDDVISALFDLPVVELGSSIEFK